MKKKFLLCINFIILVLVLIIYIREINDEDYSLAVGDCMENLNFVIDGRIQESIQCYYHEWDGIYYLFLPSYADLKDVRVSFQGADAIQCADGEASVEIKRGKAIGVLNINTPYKCTFVQGEKEIQTITLQVMKSANLPTVFIETETGSLESIEDDKSYKEPGNFVMFSKDGRVEWIDDLHHITGRGNDTWSRPKKSFGIRLASKADLLGMGATDHWILLGNVVDDIYIRNKITYDMAIAAGMEWAPESHFIDLYINHEYHGMYQLSEKVEIDTQRIALHNLERENAQINEDYKTVGSFGDDRAKGVSLLNTPEDISGGYLIERDIYDKYAKETSGFQSKASGEYYTIKSPEHASEPEVSYIQNLFSEMEKAVGAVDGINPDTQKSYLEYIDLDSFAQKYLIEEISKNYGGGASSSYFYKPDDTVSDKIFAGPVWDYDKAYGKVAGYIANPRDLCYLTLRFEGTRLFENLYQLHEEFREKVAEYWSSFYSGYLEEVYEEKIDDYYTEIAESAKMDRIRWEVQSGWPEENDWEEIDRQRLENLKNFISERKIFLDEVWIDDAEICTVTFELDSCQVYTTLGVIKGETVVPLVKDNFRVPAGMYLEGWYDTETGELFDASKPVERSMYLKGKLAKLQ